MLCVFNFGKHRLLKSFASPVGDCCRLHQRHHKRTAQSAAWLARLLGGCIQLMALITSDVSLQTRTAQSAALLARLLGGSHSIRRLRLASASRSRINFSSLALTTIGGTIRQFKYWGDGFILSKLLKKVLGGSLGKFRWVMPI